MKITLLLGLAFAASLACVAIAMTSVPSRQASAQTPAIPAQNTLPSAPSFIKVYGKSDLASVPVSHDSERVMSAPINPLGTIGLQINIIHSGEPGFSYLRSVSINDTQLASYPVVKIGIDVINNNLNMLPNAAPYQNLITKSEFDTLATSLPLSDVGNEFNGQPTHGIILENHGTYYYVLVGA